MSRDKGVVIVISGPSGSGKGAVLARMREDHNEFVISVSATTRHPRIGEIDGVHYFFKDKQQFRQMIDEGEILEWVLYCDNYYGTPKSFILDTIESGRNVIIEVEVNGALNIKNSFPESVLVFIMPPTFEELGNRIDKRGSETDDTRAKRLKTALLEIEASMKYEYIIINDDLDDAASLLNCIVAAQKARVERRMCFVEDLLKEGLSYEGKQTEKIVND